MTIDTPSDSDLITRTLAGDRGAFDALVRRHYRAAFAVALAHCGTRADAEDVCHDAFVRVAAKLDECRQRERFRYWLCTIVRNHARNAAAYQKVRRTEPLEHGTAAAKENPLRDAEIGGLRERLEAALGALPAVQREVVLLHDLDGWPHEAIAETIGTSVGMCRQHLFHARRRLRELLGENTSKEHFDE